MTTAERRTGRRLLLGGGLAAMATGAALTPGRAEGASGTSPWLLGGNTGVTNDGTNYLGTKNVAPLIFKTASTTNAPVERARITSAGRVGIATDAPVAQLDVRAFSGVGIQGRHTGAAGSQAGVVGETNSNDYKPAGILGRSTSPKAFYPTGVSGTAAGDTGIGVSGLADYAGVRGSSNVGSGVLGEGLDQGTSAGVLGNSYSYAAGAAGVRGQIVESGAGASSAVEGAYLGGGDSGVGVWGRHDGGGYGVYGTSARGYAGYFDGDVHVTGTVSKAAASSVIDHPLDPATKTLTHSLVESDEMKTVYDGTVTTDDTGRVEVRLPPWFEALNKDVRYQLTVVGQFTQAVVASKVSGGRFVIATEKPRVEVCWQVTGVRQDAYAAAHRPAVEAAKPVEQRGTYLHPELFGHGTDRRSNAGVAPPIVDHDSSAPRRRRKPRHTADESSAS